MDTDFGNIIGIVNTYFWIKIRIENENILGSSFTAKNVIQNVWINFWELFYMQKFTIIFYIYTSDAKASLVIGYSVNLWSSDQLSISPKKI